MENALQRRPWLAPLLLALLTVILLRPAIIPPERGQVLNSHDLQSMFYPLQQYIRQTLQDGELPLWNPHQFIGQPVAGNPHAALFYPPNWLVWLIGVQRGIELVLVFHIWLGAWGMDRLARRLGNSATGSLLAGVIYAMSGWAGAHLYAGHYNLMMVFAWIPWGIAAYHYALERGDWPSVLPGMAVLGAALLAGYPPLLIYLGFSWAALWVYQTALADDPVRAGWYAGLRLAAIGIGGLILGAALVLPAAELGRLSARDPNDLAFANQFALPPAQLLSFVLPGLFGNPQTGPYYYWGADFVEEFTAYVGLLPLLAVPLAIRRARRETWYCVGLIALGLVLSLGLEGALMPLLVRWVPGFGYFRVPARALLLVVIGLAGLTAQVITDLQASTTDERREWLRPALRFWLPGGIGTAFALSAFFSGWYASASHVEPMPLRAFLVAGTLAQAGMIGCGVWLVLWLWTKPDLKTIRWAQGLTVLLIVLDAWHVLIPMVTFSQVIEAPIWTGARTNVPAVPDRVLMIPPFGGPENGASVTGHLHVRGYDPLHIKTFDELQKLTDVDDPTARVNTLFGVNYVLATQPYDNPAFELAGIAYDSFYYRRINPFPRAWIASTVIVEPDDAAVRQQIAAPETDLLQTVFVDRPVDCPSSGGTAAITEYRPNNVTIQTSGGGGLLVLSDQYYPGWRATIDGKQAAIVRADTAFRAVCVPSGEHTVRFDYRPLSLIVGLILSAGGWLAWVVLVGISWLKKRG